MHLFKMETRQVSHVFTPGSLREFGADPHRVNLFSQNNAADFETQGIPVIESKG